MLYASVVTMPATAVHTHLLRFLLHLALEVRVGAVALRLGGRAPFLLGQAFRSAGPRASLGPLPAPPAPPIRVESRQSGFLGAVRLGFGFVLPSGGSVGLHSACPPEVSCRFCCFVFSICCWCCCCCCGCWSASAPLKRWRTPAPQSATDHTNHSSRTQVLLPAATVYVLQARACSLQYRSRISTGTPHAPIINRQPGAYYNRRGWRPSPTEPSTFDRADCAHSFACP